MLVFFDLLLLLLLQLITFILSVILPFSCSDVTHLNLSGFCPESMEQLDWEVQRSVKAAHEDLLKCKWQRLVVQISTTFMQMWHDVAVWLIVTIITFVSVRERREQPTWRKHLSSRTPVLVLLSWECWDCRCWIIDPFVKSDHFKETRDPTLAWGRGCSAGLLTA